MGPQMSESTNTVLNLFPIPVFVSEEFPTHEDVLTNVLEYPRRLIDAEDKSSSSRSVNTFVLGNHDLEAVSLFIKKYVYYYVHNVMAITPNNRFYVTQSWIEYGKENQKVYPRLTCNSIFSGMFILSDRTETLSFVKPTPISCTYENTSFSFSYTESNPYNGINNNITVEKNKLIMYPSNLGVFFPHHTDSRYTRAVLRFNVFFDGTLGGDLEHTDYLSITGNHD